MTVWMDSVEKTTAQSWSILGKSYYLDGDYQSSLESLNSSIADNCLKSADNTP